MNIKPNAWHFRFISYYVSANSKQYTKLQVKALSGNKLVRVVAPPPLTIKPDSARPDHLIWALCQTVGTA